MYQLFQLRPNMERYQRAMINIMTRIVSPQQPGAEGSSSSQLATETLSCPSGTPQNPAFLTVPLTAPLDHPRTAKEAKRPKEQDASKFIAGDDSQLIIGMSFTHADRIMLKMNQSLLLHPDDITHMSYFRWWRRPCYLLAGKIRGRNLWDLWNIQERPTLQGTFPDPFSGSMGNSELHLPVSQLSFSVNYQKKW